jgi:hypothetical protein
MEIYGEWAIIERFVLEFNSMVVETKGIWIASWLVIGRKIEGRKWFFLHYNWKKAKAEDIPLVFSFFPSTFIPSRLHIVACPDIKDRLWKDDIAYFWKNFLFLFNPWCMPDEIYFEVAVRDDFTYINQHFLAHILPLTSLFQLKIVSWL